MAKAQELVASYKADHPGDLNISLSTTQDATALVVAQAQQQFFTEAGFDSVQISQIEQAKYILTALQGDFQAFQWRNHGGLDLDAQYIWWSSENALPAGQLALNFGRIKDPVIDQALADEPRARPTRRRRRSSPRRSTRSSRPSATTSGATTTCWGLPHTPDVQGIEDFTLPVRRQGVPLQRHRRRVQHPVGLDQAVAARHARRRARDARRVASSRRVTGLQCARIDTVATAVVGSALAIHVAGVTGRHVRARG